MQKNWNIGETKKKRKIKSKHAQKEHKKMTKNSPKNQTPKLKTNNPARKKCENFESSEFPGQVWH